MGNLSLEFVVAYSFALLVVVGVWPVPAFRLRLWLPDVGEHMVPSAATVLLLNDGQGLRDNGVSSDYPNSAANSIPHTATDAAAHTTPNPTCHAVGASGSFQLRCGPRKHLGSGQEGVVLQDPPSRMPADCATAGGDADSSASTADFTACAADTATEASRSLQLQRWICELAGRLVRAEERMVLQGAW